MNVQNFGRQRREEILATFIESRPNFAITTSMDLHGIITWKNDRESRARIAHPSTGEATRPEIFRKIVRGSIFYECHPKFFAPKAPALFGRILCRNSWKDINLQLLLFNFQGAFLPEKPQ